MIYFLLFHLECCIVNLVYYQEVDEMNVTAEKWAGLEETAEYLGVNKDTVRNWIKKNNMPAHKIGRQWKFKLSEVDEWVKSGKSAIDN